MYSGDEYYSDEITSGPAPASSSHPDFDRWLERLNKIVQRRIGCDLDDLEDFDTYSAWEDGYTPSAFYQEVIAPEIGE